MKLVPRILIKLYHLVKALLGKANPSLKKKLLFTMGRQDLRCPMCPHLIFLTLQEMAHPVSVNNNLCNLGQASSVPQPPPPQSGSITLACIPLKEPSELTSMKAPGTAVGGTQETPCQGNPGQPARTGEKWCCSLVLSDTPNCTLPRAVLTTSMKVRDPCSFVSGVLLNGSYCSWFLNCKTT